MEGSSSLPAERTCRRAIGLTLFEGRFNNHLVSTSLLIRGNVLPENLLHDLEGNLLEMNSGLAHGRAPFRHPGTVPGRASYGSHFLGNRFGSLPSANVLD